MISTVPPTDVSTWINLGVHLLFAAAAFVALALAFRGPGLYQDHVTLRIKVLSPATNRLAAVVALTSGITIASVSFVESQKLEEVISITAIHPTVEIITGSLLILSGMALLTGWFRAFPIYLTAILLLAMTQGIDMALNGPVFERNAIDVINTAVLVALIFTAGIAYSSIYFKTMEYTE